MSCTAHRILQWRAGQGGQRIDVASQTHGKVKRCVWLVFFLGGGGS
jgi:hypothetical protein